MVMGAGTSPPPKDVWVYTCRMGIAWMGILPSIVEGRGRRYTGTAEPAVRAPFSIISESRIPKQIAIELLGGDMARAGIDISEIVFEEAG